MVYLMAANRMPAVTTTHAMIDPIPMSCITSCSPPPPTSRPYFDGSAYPAAAIPASVENNPTARTPHAPAHPCTGNAPTGSSMPTLSSRTVPPYITSAPMPPMTTAAHGSTVAVPAVMPTSPPSTPLIVRPGSYRPVMSFEARTAVTPPEVAASVVVTATFAASAAPPPVSASVEPGLNPYHPNQRMNIPSEPIAML